MGAVAGGLSLSSIAFPGYKQKAKSKLEQLGLELVQLLNSSTAGTGLTCYATVPDIQFFIVLTSRGELKGTFFEYLKNYPRMFKLL